MTFETRDLAAWDSGLLAFLVQVFDQCQQKGIEIEKTGLPQGCSGCSSLPPQFPPSERERARV